MTDKTIKHTRLPLEAKVGAKSVFPDHQVRHYNMQQDPGIVVDMEIQAGDPVDSQFIRNFMGEFERVSKTR